MQYQLTIEVTSEGLTAIYAAGLAIGIAQGSPSTAPAVLWLAFEPFRHNVIQWSDSRLLYAANLIALQPGLVIEPVAQVEAAAGWTYTLEQGVFTGTPTGPADAYGVLNLQGSTVVIGLEGQVLVSGNAMLVPMNATVVLNVMEAVVTPSETISVFLVPPCANGTILDSIPAGAVTIQFSNQTPAVTIVFDPAAMRFRLAAHDSAGD